jgi:hypothetical protein
MALLILPFRNFAKWASVVELVGLASLILAIYM